MNGTFCPICYRPSNHRPSVQAACVALGRRNALLTVHHIAEVEQVCRSLAKESARGRRLGAWGSFLHNWGLRFDNLRRLGGRRSWPCGLWFSRLRNGFHSDLRLGSRRSVLGTSGRPLPLFGSSCGAGSCTGSCGAGASTVSSTLSEFSGIVASASAIF